MKKQFFCYFNELRKNIRNFCGLLRENIHNFCGLLRENIHEFQIFFIRIFKTYAI